MKTHHIEYYRNATNSKFYWRLKARNGRVISDGSEGYDTRQTLIRAVRRIKAVDFANIPVEEVSSPTHRGTGKKLYTLRKPSKNFEIVYGSVSSSGHLPTTKRKAKARRSRK